ncbi:hypothetical protein J31TS4_12970 [Paenibacillus sp. J31TS4]|uniref:DUF4247 domain-containing protein n=1 Tax=Paenibacillus sp. J31TS4 TaxID=2807195 RepID=UPI001B13BD75|nr:DUF4247 domain-containing protein [Paenibacillus sp. J31TS4]GIP38017.1 hypothetical protein J31TS4_12970 [Paenibacillus sp. J31TS4]
MNGKKRWPAWIAALLVFTLLVGCSDAGSYVKEHYPLTDVQGSGKDISKIYLVEGKNVPQVAKEIASSEKPKEVSEDSNDRMFLLYTDKLINLQKDPEDDSNTLVEVSTVEYVKNHYDNSFLEGYLTASLLQSLFGSGGGFFGGGSSGKTYRGYSSDTKNYSGRGDPSTDSSSKTKTPATTDRTGSFNTKPGSSDSGSSSSTAPKAGSSGSFNTKPSTGSSSSSSKSSSSSSARKSDGSSPSYKSKTTAPKTSSRSGSFSKRR